MGSDLGLCRATLKQQRLTKEEARPVSVANKPKDQ
jgi:hypothetical protein